MLVLEKRSNKLSTQREPESESVDECGMLLLAKDTKAPSPSQRIQQLESVDDEHRVFQSGNLTQELFPSQMLELGPTDNAGWMVMPEDNIQQPSNFKQAFEPKTEYSRSEVMMNKPVRSREVERAALQSGLGYISDR